MTIGLTVERAVETNGYFRVSIRSLYTAPFDDASSHCCADFEAELTRGSE